MAQVTFTPDEIAAFPEGPPGVPPEIANVRHVDPAAGETIQDAYDSLPPSGGTIVLYPGVHTGRLNGSSTKPAVLTSPSGSRVRRHHMVGAVGDSDVLLRPAAGDDRVVDIGHPATIGHGWQFHGLVFDMSAPTTAYGIAARNCNHGRVIDCGFYAEENPAVEKYGVIVSADAGLDCSWWRIRDSFSRKAGLCDLTADQHVVSHNVVFPGSAHGVKFTGCTRSMTLGNEITGVASGKAAILLAGGRQNVCMGDGGEDVWTFIKSVGSTRNLFAPLGITSLQQGKKLIDDDTPLDNTVLTSLVRQVDYAEAKPVPSVVTGTSRYIIGAADRLVLLDSSTNNTAARVPSPVNHHGRIITVRRVDTVAARTASFDTAAGSIDGAAQQFLAPAGGCGDRMSVISDGAVWRSL